MDQTEWELLFPSSAMREAVQASGRQFSDWEKAALLWRWDKRGNPWRQALWDLRHSTEDSTLKSQLTDHLTWEDRAFALFQDNEDRQQVYILSAAWDERFFAKYEDALREGLKAGTGFTIARKYIGVDRYNIDYSKIEGGEERRIVARLRFDEKGSPEFFESIEIPKPNEVRGDAGLDRFENRFVELPYPFAVGDLVWDLRIRDLGIVMSSQEDMEERRRRKWAWRGNEVMVLMLPGWDEFKTEYIPSVYLERGPKTAAECQNNIQKLMLFAGKLVREGKTVESIEEVRQECWARSRRRKGIEPLV